jgi:hypothetical protein
MKRGPENWATYLVAGFVVCALTTEASASLKGYCTAYGNEAADRKTGIAGSAKSISATAAKKWQTAYDKAFSSCMTHYQVEVVKAAAVPAADKVSDADKVPVTAKVQKTEKVPETDEASDVTEAPLPALEKKPEKKPEKKLVKVASASAVDKKPVEKKPAKARSGKPKPGTKAWADYCAAKYRSYDAETERYKSYTGEYRPCR